VARATGSVAVNKISKADRTYDAKNTVNQDPGSEEQHQCRSSHNRMRKRDYTEDNCSDPP